MNENRLLVARMRTLAAVSNATLHELRGAANALALQVELLSSRSGDGDAPDDLARRIAILRDERRRLVSVAEAFLRQALLPDPEPRAFDPGELATAAVALVRPKAIELRTTIEPPTAPAPAPDVFARRDVVLDVVVDLLLDCLGGGTNSDGMRVNVAPSPTGMQIVLRGATPSAEALRRAAELLEWAGARLGNDGSATAIDLPAAETDEEAEREA